MTRDDVSALYELSPTVECVNYYGSTETQRAVSYYVIARQEQATRGFPRRGTNESLPKAALPLGRGIRDVQLLVLSPAGRLAGIGEVGEIHFRSHHLARGYLGDDERTRERFLPNPFASDAERRGDRLYRTDDLGRYLPDGNVEFLGRADAQVKIRGFRIELGEIEAALGRHPGVRECAAGVRESAAVRRLAAWVVPAAGRPSERELREFLAARLPDYMVPSAWVFLAALPLTRTGKLDRS
ncbi:MAG: amino acid adenylation domain-containing protein, partial [bacterium]|nr:amino acid adenylation domain-containing protein [bacterium]